LKNLLRLLDTKKKKSCWEVWDAKVKKASFEFAAGNWMTVGALAACFALGIYLGGFGLSGWHLDPTDSFASLSGGLTGRAGLTGEGAQMAEIGDLLAGSGTGEDLL